MIYNISVSNIYKQLMQLNIIKTKGQIKKKKGRRHK